MKHIEEIFSYAIKNEITPIVVHSYNIVDSDQKDINLKLLNADIITKFAPTVMQKGVSSLQVAKFSNVLESLFRNCPKLATEKCTFLPDMIKFADFESVKYFFIELLRAKDDETIVFSYLRDIQMPQRIVDEIQQSAGSENNELVVGLLELVTVFAGYPVMRKVFQTQENIEKLYISQHFDNNIHILNVQWESLANVCDGDSLDSFVGLIDIARKKIDEIGEVFYQFHAFCFNFLASMCQCTNAKERLSGMCKNIMNVFSKFTSHTIALGAASNLAIKLAAIDESVVTELVPFIAHVFSNKDVVITRAWAFKTLQELHDINENTQQIVEELAKDVWDEYKSMSNTIKAEYGGKTPKNDRPDAMMQEANLEQIRLICRLLLQR